MLESAAPVLGKAGGLLAQAATAREKMAQTLAALRREVAKGAEVAAFMEPLLWGEVAGAAELGYGPHGIVMDAAERNLAVVMLQERPPVDEISATMHALGLAHVPVHVVTVAFLLEPVGAALLALALLGQPIGWPEVLGAALLLYGAALVSRSQAGRNRNGV